MSDARSGVKIALQTTSDTAEIEVGRILVAPYASGDVLATTVAGVDVVVMGVSASKVASRTTAAKADISVQVSGVVSVPKPIDLQIFAGNMVSVINGTTTVGTGSGSTCLYATAATTLSSGYVALGRCVKNATTTDTEVEVNLNLES